MARERWAAREMSVVRWLKEPQTTASIGEPICEIKIDGQNHTVLMPAVGDVWGIYGPLVELGDEVPPWGELFEYSDGGFVLRYQHLRGRVPRRSAYRRRARYPRIFVNYRREDGEAYAGRLHEVLSDRFGPDEVFLNIFSISPGEPFPWAIQQSVAHCDVMVCVVGPKWLDIAGPDGKRRLDSEFDYVRREILAGLDRRILVIPVLLPGTAVPDISKIPQELREFEQLQMLDLTARHWKDDVDHLTAAIRGELARIDDARRGRG